MSITTHAYLGNAGQGIILSDRTTLHMSLSLSYSWTDNVSVAARANGDSDADLQNPDSDEYLGWTAQAYLVHNREQTNAQARVFAGGRLYVTFEDLDNNYYGADLSLGHSPGSGENTYSLSIFWQHLVDTGEQPLDELLNPGSTPLLEPASERAERDNFSGSIGWSNRSVPNWNFSLDLSAGFSLYEDQENFDDNLSTTLKFSAGWSASLRTEYSLNLSYGLLNSDGYIDPAQSASASVGVNYNRHKYSTSLSLGVNHLDRTDTRVLLPGENEDDLKTTSVNVGFSLSHDATEKIGINASVSTGFNAIASSGTNASQNTTGSIGLSHKTIPGRLSTLLTATARLDKYLDPVVTNQGLVDEEKLTLSARLSLNYTITSWAFASASIDYEESKSEIDSEEYDQTTASVGLALSY